jgi:hypothetical protein
MGRYPDGSATDTDAAVAPSLSVGAAPGGTDTAPLLLTGSDARGNGTDSLGNPTANKAVENGQPGGPVAERLAR